MINKILTNKIVRRIIIVIILISLGCWLFVTLAFNTCIIQKGIYRFKRIFTNEQVIFIGQDPTTRHEIVFWKYPPIIPNDTTLTMKKMLLLFDKYVDLSNVTNESYRISFDLYDKDMDNYNLKQLFRKANRVKNRLRVPMGKSCLQDDFYDLDEIASIQILLSPLNREPESIELRVGYYGDIFETNAFEKILLPIEEHKDDSELSKFYYQLLQSKKSREIESPNIDMPEVIFWTFKDGIKHISKKRQPLDLDKGGTQ